MSRNKSRKSWINRHINDAYVQSAQKEGYRSRASYKLIEIDSKYTLFKPGMTIVDLGAAPGGWSQVAQQKVGDKGQVIALDLLTMPPIDKVGFIQGDFTSEETYAELQKTVGDKQIDWVLSDMAPNLSGVRAVDQPKSIMLAEYVLDFAVNYLKPGGGLLLKVFQGEGFQEYLADMRKHFKQVATQKPQASRSSSRELYLLARYYNRV